MPEPGVNWVYQSKKTERPEMFKKELYFKRQPLTKSVRQAELRTKTRRDGTEFSENKKTKPVRENGKTESIRKRSFKGGNFEERFSKS